MSNEEITVEISTKNRYYTTLPLCLAGIANQSYSPKKVIKFDDGEQEDLRKNPTYASLFNLFNSKNIGIEVIFGNKKGQVHNHQAALDIIDTEWIWRIDDDDIPEYNALELMVKNIKDDVGAISGLIIDPSAPKFDSTVASSNIEDIFIKPNIQWSRFSNIADVDHINNSFLFRRSASKHGYCMELSPVGHREETLFTYGIKLQGYRLLIDPKVIIWHCRSPVGGIRSYEHTFFWEHDERIFRNKLKEYGVLENKLIVLDNGLGDHYAFRSILSEVKGKYRDLILAVCYPEVFEEENVQLISIQEAGQYMIDKEKQNVYKWMMEHKWKKSIVEAYRKMFVCSEDL